MGSTAITTTAKQQQHQRKFPRDWLQKLVVTAGGENQNNPANIIYALAPMVDQSDLPFRLQCRKYGCNICFTPMIHAKLFVTQKAYRQKFSVGNVGNNHIDRPLIAQVCGSDHKYVLETAKMLQESGNIDGIDINCGCPQNIAKRGHYGAFLLEDKTHLIALIRALAHNSTVPISVKVRLLPSQSDPYTPDVPASLDLYRQLVDAGASLLSIHARTRFQKSVTTGTADWHAIRTVVQELGATIPILANGGIGHLDDVQACLDFTQADGVMSSEAILEYPALFWPLLDATKTLAPPVPSVQLALEYLDFAEQYPTDVQGQGNGFKTVRNHMHKFLHGALQEFTNVRDMVVQSKNINDLRNAIYVLRDTHGYTGFKPMWYQRYRNKGQKENTTNGAISIAVSRRAKAAAAAAVETTPIVEERTTKSMDIEASAGTNTSVSHHDDEGHTEDVVVNGNEEESTKRQRME